MLVLLGVDALAASPGTGGGSVLFLLLAALYAALAFGVSKLAGLAAARAVALGSLVAVAAFVPNMARLHDAPLVAQVSIKNPPLYSGAVLLAVGACIFVVVLASHGRLEAKSSPAPPKDRPRPDHRLFGSVVIVALLSVPLVVSRVRLRPVTDLAVVETYADMKVPALDSVDVDTIPIFDDGAVAVSAVRTHPLPLKIARLEVDLRDGVGSRPVLAVGGGERLRLVHSAQLVWELCHVPPDRPKDAMFSSKLEPCVTLARFMTGGGSFEPRVSAVRGKVGPPPGVFVLATLALVGCVAALAASELSRRKLLRVMSGRQAVLQRDGAIESFGERYVLRQLPKHLWAGPVVLLDVAENAGPYRETRSAGSAVPGTIEQHVAWYSRQRLMLHQIIDVPCLVVIANLATAGLVGYWGF